MMQMQHYFLPFLLPLLCTWSLSICAEAPNIPKQIKIGALFAFNSTIGRLAQPAIQLAVKDINDSPDVLNGTKLEIEMFDTGCEPLQGAATAVQLLQKGVVAVVGPQSSATAQFVAHIAKQTRVPFVSFGATDPSLSKTQYPFFFRVVPSDSLQMQAVAAFIANFGWTEVAVIYVDDDYGTNGATSLSDSLQVRGSKVVDKVALNPLIDKDGIDMQLIGLLDRQTRVFVLHTYPNVGHLILQEAYIQNMLSIGFVWIVTDLMSNSLGGAEICHNILKFAQGVIGIRQFALPTSQLGRFLMEWHDGTQTQSFDMDATCINPYLLCAYDAVWTIGRALHSFINERGMFQFKEPIKFPTQSGGMSELVQLKEFQGGNKLRALLLNTSFQGTSGFINFDGRGDIVETVFEFVNIVGKSLHPVGYWSTHGVGVSLTPPLKYSFTRTKGQDYVSDAAVTEMKMPIIWPGKSTDVPGSLVLPQNRTTLKIGVPYKVGYNEIIRVINQSSNSTRLYGFCISVFEAALHYLPFSLSYNYVLVGDGQMTPSYDDLILRLANQEFDALVGDFSIVAERLKLVDFIQPYLESGLVVLVPVRNKKNSPWAFLRPFTSHLWLTVLFSFLLTGTAIWILEHRVNEDFRGPPKTQFITVIT